MFSRSNNFAAYGAIAARGMQLSATVTVKLCFTGRLKTREWQKCRGGNRGTRMQGWNSRDWKSRHQIAGVKIAGVEIVAPEGRGWKRGRNEYGKPNPVI